MKQAWSRWWKHWHKIQPWPSSDEPTRKFQGRRRWSHDTELLPTFTLQVLEFPVLLILVNLSLLVSWGGSRLFGIPHWILYLGMTPDMSGDHRTFLVSVYWARSICITRYLPQEWRSQHSWWFLSPLCPLARSWHQCSAWFSYNYQP